MDSLSDWMRMIYGLFMGVSTPLIQPEERGLVKLEKIKIDGDFWIFKGGSGNGCVVRAGSELLLVNSNKGSSSEEIYHFLLSEFSGCVVKKIINTQCGVDYSGGNSLYPDCRDITVGNYPRQVLVNEMGDRKLPSEILSSRKKVEFGEEVLELIPLGGSVDAGPLLVYFEKRKILLGAVANFSSESISNELKNYIGELGPSEIY